MKLLHIEHIGGPLSIDTTSPRTRRTVLATGLGVIAATMFTAIGRPTVANAADNGQVLLGNQNVATNPTYIQTTQLNAFKGDTSNGIAVSGESDTGLGVYGFSKSNDGIRGYAGTLVLATLQHNRAGVWIQSAVPNAADDSFTVTLNKAVSAATTVACFLVN